MNFSKCTRALFCNKMSFLVGNYIVYYSYGWQPRGDVLASRGGQCAAVLVYTVKLVKPGAVKYTYQFTDDNIIFEFQVKNSLSFFMFVMIQYSGNLYYII